MGNDERMDPDVALLLAAALDVVSQVPHSRWARWARSVAKGEDWQVSTTTVPASTLIELRTACNAWALHGKPLGDHVVAEVERARLERKRLPTTPICRCTFEICWNNIDGQSCPACPPGNRWCSFGKRLDDTRTDDAPAPAERTPTRTDDG